MNKRTKLLKKTEDRMTNTLNELKTFAKDNDISLDQAINIQLIDAVRGVSHRVHRHIVSIEEHII